MTDVNKKLTISCPKCSAPIETWHRPIISAVRDAERYRHFLADTLLPKKCICGLGLDLASPTAIETEHWTGLALENPNPISVSVAAAPVNAMVSDFSRPILVVGRSHELRRIIENRPGDPFVAQRFDYLVGTNFDFFIEYWQALADAYMAVGQAARGYWFIERDMSNFKMQIHPRILEILEMLSLAAGNVVLDGLIHPMRACDDFASKMEDASPQLARLPSWMKQTFFCFFQHGPHPDWGSVTMVSTIGLQTNQDARGALDIAGAQMHYTACPVQAVARPEIDHFHAATGYLIVLMSTAEARMYFKKLPEDLKWCEEAALAQLALKWRTPMYLTSSQRKQLDEMYFNWGGGRGGGPLSLFDFMGQIKM